MYPSNIWKIAFTAGDNGNCEGNLAAAPFTNCYVLNVLRDKANHHG